MLRQEKVASKVDERCVRGRREIEDEFSGKRRVIDKPSCDEASMDLFDVV